MRRIFLFSVSLLLTGFSFGQEKFWKFVIEQSTPKLNTPQLIVPKIYRTLSLSFDRYKTLLSTAPKEIETSIKNGLQITLPYPDNSFKRFKIVETKMMEDGLAAQFPGIKTYIGQGIDDPASSVRIDYTYQGFHAYVISPGGTLFIDPYQKANNNLYITYFSKDYENLLKANFKCAFADKPAFSENSFLVNSPVSRTSTDVQLKTYRVAISCTGEYAARVCPIGNITVANTMSAIVTTMNRVNAVYQTELALKMVLIAANASIVYTDPDTDPYSGNDNGSILINESQSNITSVIGSENFDIGHTFSTGGGGLAEQGGACDNFIKAKGISGNPSPLGDVYDIDFVAHEIGHQFGAAHTFESETGNCGIGGNRIKLSAYEVGSGTTIMGYAGICDSDNIQANSNNYFHTKSSEEIITYTTSGTGSTCPVVTTTGNHVPVITMPASDIKIPKGTPFTLTGSATDSDVGDVLTYSWEEWDISNQNAGSAWNSGAFSTIRPLFKVRNPKISGSRTFPDIEVINAGYPANPPAEMDGLKGETMPQVARDIKFRLMVRDNHAGGGGVAMSSNNFKVIITDDGPFTLTVPNTAVNWLGGSIHTVKWDVANTDDVTGINAQNVDILMSTDGGTTFSTALLTNTPNDGSEDIIVPNIPTNSSVRFKVQASGSIFFDISDVDFTITFNSVLPDSLLQFSVKPVGNSIQLTWSTVMEINNKGFEVLRSEGTSNNFIKIAFVASTGSSNSIQNYTFNDNTVKTGVDYFYRLRQIDVNNYSVYSSIKRAKIDADGKFSISIQPQPLHAIAEVSIDGVERKNFRIIISDVMGRIIIEKEIKNNEQNRLIPVDLSHEASGIYIIKVLQNNIQKTLKAVKL